MLEIVLKTYVLIILLLNGASYAQLALKQYKLCGGKGTIKEIKVSPCTEEPCRFKRNSKIEVDFEAAFDQPTNTVKLVSIAQVGETNMTLVGTPTDFCAKNIVVCPLKGRGDFRKVKFFVPIKSFYNPKPYNATFLGYGDKGLELCVQVLVEIV